jgi:hypothetical protein
MSKKRWIVLVVVLVSVQVAFGLTSALGVKRIGNLYPVQGVFVAYCTDTDETPPADCTYTQSAMQWNNLPGATQTFNLPADRVAPGDALIFGRFSAQTRCTSGPGSCLVRMRLTLPNGTTTLMKPSPVPTTNGLAFDSTSTTGYASHAIEQTFPQNVGPGTYTLTVQVAVAKNANATTTPTFRFDSWTLVTEIAFTTY